MLEKRNSRKAIKISKRDEEKKRKKLLTRKLEFLLDHP